MAIFKGDFMCVAYYTPNTIYDKYALRLEKSARDHGVPIDIVPVPNQGNWYKNVNYKPQFILDMMEKHGDHYEALGYVDVDATFERFPELFRSFRYLNSIKFAIHPFDRSCYHDNRGKTHELVSSCMYIRNCTDTIQLMVEWAEECQANQGVWDQVNLENIIKGRYYPLPFEYCKIFDKYECEHPVIKQWQASREVRANNYSLKEKK